MKDPQPMKAGPETTPNPVPISDASYFDREVRWLRMDARKARWITVAIFCALVLYLIVIATLATGPINVFHNDALWMLDNGWRVLNGQVPHHDFYTPIGPLALGIIAGGMLLANGSAQGLAIGFAVFGFVLGIWGWLLARQRMPSVFALLVTAWLVFTATSPTPLGFGPAFLSCAMIHNREGYGLVGLILIECAFAREKARFWGGLSSGIALVLLGFLKLNFFGVAGLMLLASVPLRRVELPRLWGFLAGAAGTVLAFSLYPRFSLPAFFSDMWFVLQANAALNRAATISALITCARSGAMWLVAAMTAAITVLISPQRRWSRQTVSLIVLSFIVLVSGLLFLQTNSLENRCQLASLWTIILFEQISAIHLRVKTQEITVALIALSVGGTAAALVPDVASAFHLISYQSSAAKVAGIQIAAPGMENVRFYDSTSFYDKVKAGDGDGVYYANCLNDGMALLKSQSKPDESILVLGFTNPYSYLLRRKPAEGGNSFLFLGASISENHMPSVNRIFGDADLMILPQYEGTHQSGDLFIQNYYHPYLVQNFRFVARSQCWSLYRRNK
jgi:hypothetical protein